MLHPAGEVELPLGVGQHKVVVEAVVVTAGALGQHRAQQGGCPDIMGQLISSAYKYLT